MFVQNGSKPSVSNWWKQCQRLTRLCSTVRGITQQSSTHADGPIYICTCPYHCFYGLLLFTCLSLGSQSRWCGNEDRYAVYTEGEGVEFYITDLKNQTYKGIHLFLFYIRVYNIIYNVTCMYRFHIDWQHGRFSCVGSVSIFSRSLCIFVQYVMCLRLR